MSAAQSSPNCPSRRIEANRAQNEVAGDFGALLIVPAIAVEGNDADRNEIARLSQPQDTLVQLAAGKGCAAPN